MKANNTGNPRSRARGESGTQPTENSIRPMAPLNSKVCSLLFCRLRLKHMKISFFQSSKPCLHYPQPKYRIRQANPCIQQSRRQCNLHIQNPGQKCKQIKRQYNHLYSHPYFHPSTHQYNSQYKRKATLLSTIAILLTVMKCKST